MRLRFALLASLVSALALAVTPGVAAAAPKHNHGLTIRVVPNPIDAGQGVIIYGQLKGSDVANKRIVLYHHLNGSPYGYSRIGSTVTDAAGYYEFTREVGVVWTNRSWFVREGDQPRVHSRTVHERVRALVSLAASDTTPDTRHAVVFSGHVSPDHRYQRVYLQEEKGTSDDWRTLKAGYLNAGSSFLISYRWSVPGSHTLRAVFAGDYRNYRGVSDSVTVQVQQAQVPGFTISSSQPVVPEGSSVTISGVLDQPTSSAASSAAGTPEPNTSVTLWQRTADQSGFHALTSTLTDQNGKYSFTVQPSVNTLYQVRTTLRPHRSSAVLFQGVRDVITLNADTSRAAIDRQVVLSGAVTPDKAGHHVYLQRKGSDGEWHTVAVSTVRSDSTFRFVRRPDAARSVTYRARIYSDEHNVGAASTPVTVTVIVPPVSTLPTAS